MTQIKGNEISDRGHFQKHKLIHFIPRAFTSTHLPLDAGSPKMIETQGLLSLMCCLAWTQARKQSNIPAMSEKSQEKAGLRRGVTEQALKEGMLEGSEG